MTKTEYLGTSEVAKLLGIPATDLYGWVGNDSRKRRPFFPKSQKRRSPKGNRRLIHQWITNEVLEFIKTAKEKPYYLLSENQYEKLKAKTQQQERRLVHSDFVDFNKLMFAQKQKRMEAVNG